MTKRIEGAEGPIDTNFFDSVQRFAQELFPGPVIIRSGANGLGYRIDAHPSVSSADKAKREDLLEGIGNLSEKFLPGWEVREGKAGVGVDINPPR